MADAAPFVGARSSKIGPSAQPLTLLTLAGEALPVVDLNAHVSLQGFENAVLEELPYLGNNSTFGCELQFVQTDTNAVLADPIQSKSRANQCFYVLARHCFVEATQDS